MLHHLTDARSRQGAWEDVEHRVNYLPTNTALLHSGKVLAFGGSGNGETRLTDPHPAELFDPETGTVTVLDQELAGEVFCAGHAFPGRASARRRRDGQ